MFLFFQAEDGIRDRLVTGVQTCALPIFTPLDELLSMEGIDEKIGQSILEQVKQRLENLENV